MSIRRYRIGDFVSDGAGLIGTVVTFRDLGSRQALTVHTTDDTLVSLTVDLNAGSTVVLEPTRVSDAVTLAAAIASGQEPRLSVTTQLLTLAGAVLALADTNVEAANLVRTMAASAVSAQAAT